MRVSLEGTSEEAYAKRFQEHFQQIVDATLDPGKWVVLVLKRPKGKGKVFRLPRRAWNSPSGGNSRGSGERD